MNYRIAARILMLFFVLLNVTAYAKHTSTYYQVTVYHYKNADQEKLIDEFLRDAYLPGLHNKGQKNIGVFKPLANDTAADKTIYVIQSFKDIKQLANLANETWDVSAYGNTAGAYLNSNYKTPPYSRMERMVINAFDMAPQFMVPNLTSPKSDHIYEFRSYEGATEKLHNNKVKMFNQGGEIALFKRLNFNAVFYGKVIAGAQMPNLVYMTSFENKEERDAHWKSFSADAEWKKLSAMPEYQNNVSRNETILMKAAEYSDF
ncbi:MAG: NIPSNAP family protein [Chitinophagaceae bacterium]|nr:NIPSNAP family protein [Chitinophagaceae bacterium]